MAELSKIYFQLRNAKILSMIMSKPLFYAARMAKSYLGLDARKPVFGGLRTTKAQTSRRIHADRSGPLLFAYWKTSYIDLLQAKFHFSS